MVPSGASGRPTLDRGGQNMDASGPGSGWTAPGDHATAPRPGPAAVAGRHRVATIYRGNAAVCADRPSRRSRPSYLAAARLARPPRSRR